MKRCYILAIETSCDETSAAVIEEGTIIRSNVVSSQSRIHERYGGVVPEVASRKHVEQITYIIEAALKQAAVKREDLSAIAVTQGPGLVGALIVGIAAAKSLALALGLPLIGVHHIAGHIYANQLVADIPYPAVALVVSGGHTELVRMDGAGQFELIGQTRDDAVGEAYDKVARALQLPYPGGPHVDRLAGQATGEIEMPRAWLEPQSYDFSFSGLKSAVFNALNKASMQGRTLDPAHVAKGFQQSVIDVLVEKSVSAMRMVEADTLLVCGGVAANRGLRERLTARCEREQIKLCIPPPELCTDNAAMIGAAAFVKWKQGLFDPLELNAEAQISLQDWMN